MSVVTRIRRIGDIAISVALAVAVLVLFSVWASVGVLPGILSLGPASAVAGLLAATSLCVVLALSIQATERRLELMSEATQPLQPQTSYRFPPA
jgi:hypothetical protein